MDVDISFRGLVYEEPWQGNISLRAEVTVYFDAKQKNCHVCLTVLMIGFVR